jgi:hypothetical protein
MKRSITYFLFLFLILLAACKPDPTTTPIYSRDELVGSQQTATSSPVPETEENSLTEGVTATPSEAVITPTPTENPFATLYDCEMKLEFSSGPLESKSTEFTVLGQDYFTDKGDKFFPGKGTSIYYQYQHYFILHSSYVNGNALRPMEAELLRKYLEYWGDSGNDYVEGQMNKLIGSEVSWICDGQTVFKTEIDSIVHLSHLAAQDIWMNPNSLEEIIMKREGEESEWIGEMPPTREPYLYVGFCGWGPSTVDTGRYTYFRYVMRFIIQ